MKTTLTILALLFVVILQTTLIPFITLWGITPNLVLILIIALTVLKKFENVWWLVIITGFFLDLLIGLPLGLASLSLVLTAYLIDWFNQNIFSGIKLWIMGSLIVLGSLVYNLLLFGLSKVFQIDLVFSLGLASAGYNLGIILIIYAGIKKILR